MNIRLIQVPYDSGQAFERMGLGPKSLLEAGLEKHIASLGHRVESRLLISPATYPAEIESAFAVAEELRKQVQAAREAGWLPMVLAGNCNVAIGVLAALGMSRTAVLWFDAHGEFNTPETTASGFLDGMGLATATGKCWTKLSRKITGFSPLPAKNVVLAGVRDTDSEEQAALDASGTHVLRPEAFVNGNGRLQNGSIEGLRNNEFDRLYLHFDLDSLDPDVARWNAWAPPGGLSLDQIKAAIDVLVPGPEIPAITFASHDPSVDPQRSFEAVRDLIGHVLQAIAAGKAPSA